MAGVKSRFIYAIIKKKRYYFFKDFSYGHDLHINRM